MDYIDKQVDEILQTLNCKTVREALEKLEKMPIIAESNAQK